MIRVTIFLPVRNGERYIRETLDSIAQQTYRNFKVTLLDNESTDQSIEIALGYSDLDINVVKADRLLSLAENFNRAFKLVDTEFFCIMHADDVYEPHYLSEMCALMDENPQSLAGYCNITTIDETSKETRDLKYEVKNFYPVNSQSIEEQLRTIFSANLFCAPSIFFRKGVVKQIGYYNNYEFNLDWDYSLRILEHGARFVKCERRLFRYRIHSQQLTSHYVLSTKKYRERLDFLQDHKQVINSKNLDGVEINSSKIKLDIFKIIIWDMRNDFAEKTGTAYSSKKKFVQEVYSKKFLLIYNILYHSRYLGLILILTMGYSSALWLQMRYWRLSNAQDDHNS